MILYYLLKITGHLPFFAIYFLSDVLYYISFYVIRYRKKVAFENLNIAFPELNKLEKQAIMKKFYHNLCDLIMETIKVQSMDPSDFKERVSIKNSEIMISYLLSKTSVIALVGHVGNHEWMGIAGGIHWGYPVDTIYRPLRNKAVDALLRETRKRFGNYLIPMKETTKEFLKRKEILRMIAIAGDQTPPKDEINYWGNFFGRKTPFYNGTQKLAEFTKLPVIFGYMKRIKRGYYEMVIEKLAEPPYMGNNNEIIDLYVERLEKVVRQYPDLWLWSHRKWKYS
ncbi:MAG: hypothetical protein A3H98_04090 [Bacteroidetes bacterium RIFCSPLOWO2_02_FULL_36_8]|nr:MAG: hypothetical protein A3H98_04090 [Bacteroidetes bacterium RIFCSPLOWO2_02_FULL_36_8]OFY68813.1 MAG: hypothetical protein A3G23_03215 [Bacteroidetes bacterium RIFCSPLOWO2_12_FULL_37_12]